MSILTLSKIADAIGDDYPNGSLEGALDGDGYVIYSRRMIAGIDDTPTQDDMT